MNESAPTSQTAVRENLLGVRIVAGIIDLVVIIIFGVIMSVLFGDSSSDGNGFNFSLNGLPFVIYVVLSLGYYFGFENRAARR